MAVILDELRASPQRVVEADDKPLRIDCSSLEQSPKLPCGNVLSAIIEVGRVWPTPEDR
jgi:hypothetical protein